jgi:hypothetical protein
MDYKVFIVRNYCREVVRVFSTHRKAVAFIAKETERLKPEVAYFSILEEDVDIDEDDDA